MKSHTSLVAQQTRLNEWADLIRDCQNRPQGMKIDEWCQLHDITKASYYWRLRKVREAYLETAEHTVSRNNIFADYTSPECLQSIGLLLLEKDKDYSLPDIGRIPHNIVCGTVGLNCIVYVWSDTLIIVAP